MPDIKAIIFDMDGVILDSESISAITWRKVAEEKGLTVNDEILNACRGTNKNDTIVILKNITVQILIARLSLNEPQSCFTR